MLHRAHPTRPLASRRALPRGAVSLRAAATESGPSTTVRGEDRSHTTDVVVIGSGIGGLSCAGVLAKYGFKVTVLESHTQAGGAAHTFKRQGYHFESGPSLHSDLDERGIDANPMAHVLQIIEEDLELCKYDTWNVLVPEGEFLTRVGKDNFVEVLTKIKGEGHPAIQEWKDLQEFMRPLAKASSVIPPVAIRFDFGALQTAILRYMGGLMSPAGMTSAKLTQPFSKVIEGQVKDPFIRNWLDLLCFLLSGLPADGTIAAEMAFMFNSWYKPNSSLNFPKGGSQALVDALVKGVTKRDGGRIILNSHVEKVITENGKAVGVQLRGGGVVRATKAVVSNASVWDTIKMLPVEDVPEQYKRTSQATPACRSFMHLHVGFDATGLEDLELHHIIVNSWDGGVDAPQNVVLVSIASVMDPSLAPEGCHCLHAYMPATEPYEIWKGLDKKSEEYKKLKEERSQVLWQALERIIPDIRARTKISMVGTPLTHESFLRRDRGSYGPAIKAGTGLFPGPLTPIPGLLVCGDSTFPGIGVPAVAASGTIAANTLATVSQHKKMLEDLGI